MRMAVLHQFSPALAVMVTNSRSIVHPLSQACPWADFTRETNPQQAWLVMVGNEIYVHVVQIHVSILVLQRSIILHLETCCLLSISDSESCEGTHLISVIHVSIVPLVYSLPLVPVWAFVINSITSFPVTVDVTEVEFQTQEVHVQCTCQDCSCQR